MNYTDTTPPVLTLVGPSTTSVAQFATYKDMGATARDDLDLDIPAWEVGCSTWHDVNYVMSMLIDHCADHGRTLG